MIDAGPAVVLFFSMFAGTVVSSFSGFAFSPVAGVLLLTMFEPAVAVPVLMICSIFVQVTTLVHLRHGLKFGSTAMLLGGACGVSLAMVLFHRIDAERFQLAFAVFLAAYATTMLLRPHGRIRAGGGPRTEMAVGFAGGLIGGLTAMPGAVPVLYCDCRGCPKEVQRATVQPFILAMQVLALCLMAASGALQWRVVELAVTALPALAAGIMIGLFLFGRVPDVGFRRVVLVLLLATSAGIIAKHNLVRPPGLEIAGEPPGSTFKIPAGAMTLQADTAFIARGP